MYLESAEILPLLLLILTSNASYHLQVETMLPVSRGFLRKSTSTSRSSGSSSSSQGSNSRVKPSQWSSKAKPFALTTRRPQWTMPSSSQISSVRFFNSSPITHTKASPRQSIHKFKGEDENLETDEQFLKIMEQQKQYVSEHRATEAVRAAGGAADLEESQADQARPSESQIKEDRRAIIAKMVQKHVPLQDTSKAVDMFNTIIYGFLKNGAIRDAEEVYAQMEANDIMPSKSTYHMLAKAYSQESPPMIESLQTLMDNMGSNMGPDVYVFNTLITSYAAIRRTCQARPMFELMRSHGVTEDITTCNVLLMNYAKLTDGSGLDHAEEVLLWMRNVGLSPDDTTYTALIGCCYGNLDRAIDFYEASIKAAEAGETSKDANEERLSAMLRVYASVRQLDQGQLFLTQFISKYPDFRLSSGNYGALFHLYVSCLQIKQAFDDLDAFLSAVSPNIPVATCRHVVAGLKLLPEAILPENEELLEEWETTLAKYKARWVLSPGDAAKWKICLLRWRETYTPTPGRA